MCGTAGSRTRHSRDIEGEGADSRIATFLVQAFYVLLSSCIVAAPPLPLSTFSPAGVAQWFQCRPYPPFRCHRPSVSPVRHRPSHQHHRHHRYHRQHRHQHLCPSLYPPMQTTSYSLHFHLFSDDRQRHRYQRWQPSNKETAAAIRGGSSSTRCVLSKGGPWSRYTRCLGGSTREYCYFFFLSLLRGNKADR